MTCYYTIHINRDYQCPSGMHTAKHTPSTLYQKKASHIQPCSIIQHLTETPCTATKIQAPKCKHRIGSTIAESKAVGAQDVDTLVLWGTSIPQSCKHWLHLYPSPRWAFGLAAGSFAVRMSMEFIRASLLIMHSSLPVPN